MHHDALELPDGQIILLTHLNEGQIATVLQLPAEPKTAKEAQQQTPLERPFSRRRCQQMTSYRVATIRHHELSTAERATAARAVCFCV
jgi:hypothetical protein